MDYDFIEIGTSDFNTLSEFATETTRGIAVEPVKYYFDKLPNKPGVRRVKSAIGDKPDTVKIFYTPVEIIEKYDLPYWVRGCNRCDAPHPEVVRTFDERGLPHMFETETVPVITLNTLFEECDVTGCNVLKIDTEGYDFKILIRFFDDMIKKPNPVWPNKIMFEFFGLKQYSLAEHRERYLSVHKILHNYGGAGYDHLFTDNQEDIILTKKILF
jgi:FkbM family methyltransferase